MILSFSGDQYLAQRAARRALREAGLAGDEVIEMSEGLDPEEIVRRASQGGLFGRVALLLDFDAAFSGKAGVKPRNDAIEALSRVPAESLVVVIDLSATPARQKRYAGLGRHESLPTPRYGGLISWVRGELREAGVDFERDVPETLADIFNDDLPSIAGEIAKLQVLGEKVNSARVREIAGRLPVRDAFHLIDAITDGEAAKALSVCRSLLEQGEAPQRVLGALTWQFDLVARCVAIRERGGRLPSEGQLAGVLGVKPFAARKAMGLAARLDESLLLAVLSTLLEADRSVKGGRDDGWALEGLALELSGLFAQDGSAEPTRR